MTTSSVRRSAATPAIASVSAPGGIAARRRSSKCSRNSSSPGGVQPGLAGAGEPLDDPAQVGQGGPSSACPVAAGRRPASAGPSWAGRARGRWRPGRRARWRTRPRPGGVSPRVSGGAGSAGRAVSAWQPFPHARGPLATGRKDSPLIAATQPVSLQLCPRTQGRPEPPTPMITPMSARPRAIFTPGVVALRHTSVTGDPARGKDRPDRSSGSARPRPLWSGCAASSAGAAPVCTEPHGNLPTWRYKH